MPSKSQTERRRRRTTDGAPAALASAAAALLLLLASAGGASASYSSSSSAPSLDEPFQTSFRHLPHVPCVSLFHRGRRVGCGTLGRSAATGRLVHWSAVAASDDGGGGGGGGGVDDSYSVSARVPPYVAAMDEAEYCGDNVDRLLGFAEAANKIDGGPTDDPEGAGVLRGILVLNSTAAAGGGSDGDGGGGACYGSPAPRTPRGEGTPSEQLSVGVDYAWNGDGDGMTLKNMYGIPTAYIADADVASYLLGVSEDQGSVVSKTLASGRALDEDEMYPAIVAELNYYMGPEDATSADCLAWRDRDGSWSPKCLPLGGNSVWATAGSPEVDESDDDGDGGGQDEDGGGRRLEDDGGRRPVVLLATNMDSTSMFHDASPGANAAASNILALLMAAKLLGAVPDATLDGLPKRVAFGFFQGEMYGYIGSRAFLRDVAYPGFQCDEGRTVPAVAKRAETSTKMGCLNPLRTSLEFQNLGEIVGMISVDQVGVLATDKTFYVHGENAVEDDDGTAAFLANVLLQMSSDDWTVSSSSVEADDDDAYPLPPTPLTSLVMLSEGAVGGAVLAGYDAAFADGARYQSHLDSNRTRPMDMDSIAAAATALARAALAAAYDDGGGDCEGAAEYATDLVPALGSDDGTLWTLARCLFEDGNCDALLTYGEVEAVNDHQETGVKLGKGTFLGTPPSYYPSIYDAYNGQGFVQIGKQKKRYGAYTGEEEYGSVDTDTFLLRPSLLEMSIHGLLNDFLGRGSASSSADGDEDAETELTACEGTDDCSDVPYCSASGDGAVCAGSKVCVCSRAHYHPALDEALVAAPNNFTGFFLVRDGEDGRDPDEGISAMYTEPYWSWKVGVRVYRDAGGKSGGWALGAGLIIAAACFASTWFMKRKLTKEKLY